MSKGIKTPNLRPQHPKTPSFDPVILEQLHIALQSLQTITSEALRHLERYSAPTSNSRVSIEFQTYLRFFFTTHWLGLHKNELLPKDIFSKKGAQK